MKNRSIYQYNEGMKMILNQFKFRGDYELYKAFEAEMRKVFIRDFTKIDLISFIPLSDERLYERGFNQAEVLAQLITSNAVPLLVKKEESKQSKKNRQERISTENPFILLPHIHLQDNHILLIDDIYTTGTTIRHAAQLLLQEGAKQVSSLTLIRS
ncbi:ComF family protein [Bacillus mesophilus]|uniref:ComF family protein n=1 Tax=Bacillus mesophilus TaxID=1808955 RepID=UPI003084048B|nr:ComF family protein [Bacillus mesophilus]